MCTLAFRNSAGHDHKIQVFQSGDYEYLCHLYGLSGASGINIILIKYYYSEHKNNHLQVVIAAYGA